MRLKLFLSIISICSLSFLSFSQEQEGNNSSKANNSTISNDIMFEIVLADMISLPNEPYSIANSEYYLNALENWIKNNNGQYNNLVNGVSTTKRYALTKRQFDSFSTDKQLEIKQWTKSIERLFTEQQKYLPENKKVFLLASYEFNYLKSLINK